MILVLEGMFTVISQYWLVQGSNSNTNHQVKQNVFNIGRAHFKSKIDKNISK